MNSYSSIIFDFDGVILDSVAIKAGAYAEIYRDEAPETVAAVVDYQILHGGVTRREKFRYYEAELLGRPVDDARLDALCRRYTDIVLDQVMGCAFIPGALEFLESHAERIPLHLVSGTPHEELGVILERRSLGRFFVDFTGAPTAKIEAFATIRDKGGYETDAMLVIGDSITEYDAAHALGMPFLAIIPEAEGGMFPPEVPRHPDLTTLGAFIAGAER